MKQSTLLWYIMSNINIKRGAEESDDEIKFGLNVFYFTAKDTTFHAILFFENITEMPSPSSQTFI